MNEQPLEIFLCGPGKLGLSLCLLLEKAGFRIAGVWGRRKESIRNAEDRLQGSLFYGPLPAEISKANVVFITTQDGAIEEVADEIAGSGFLSEGTVVYHCSGAFDSNILGALKNCGAVTGTIHPLQTVPTVEVGVESLPRSFFAVEGEERAVSLGKELIKAIGGEPFEQSGGKRGMYHASASMAGNYLVTLFWSAVKMMADTGLSEDEAARALRPMIKQVIEGIDSTGVHGALTGPIERGDSRTLKSQIEAIVENRPGDLPLFIALAYRTIDLVREIGDCEEERIEEMTKLLNRFKGTLP